MSRESDRYRLYDPFARVYNEHWGDFYLNDVREGFERLLLPLLPPGGRVLDLCCGTGQLSRWLVERGFQVTGLDGSEAMLRYARENAPGAEFLLADARDPLPANGFDAVLSTFDSINHLPALADVRHVFANVRRALAPGQLFVFDVNDEDGFAHADGDTFLVEDEASLMVVKSVYDAERKQGRSQGVAFERDGELWRRKNFEIPEYFYSPAELVETLATAGFERIETWLGEEDLGMPRGEGRVFFAARADRPPEAAEPVSEAC